MKSNRLFTDFRSKRQRVLFALCIPQNGIEQHIAVHLALDHRHAERFFQILAGFIVKEHIVMPQTGFRQQNRAAEVFTLKLRAEILKGQQSWTVIECP